MLTARRIIRIAREQREDATFSLIVNKVTPEADVERAEQFLGIPLLGTVPADSDVREAERAGIALLDRAPDSAAVKAITRLADRLDASNIDRL
jgi:MinD-like ATPase involved in chromosome partitioning or flagellar assembly